MKNTLYESSDELKIELNRFNYYCMYKCDGTLLNCAVSCNFVGYVELLLRNGFDPNTKKSKYTPVELAKQANYIPILSLLEDVIESDNKEMKGDDENEGKEEDMNLRSLSLRYHVTFVCVLIFISCFSIPTNNQGT